ncbi:MAG TPA: SRPBCC domain-containing protein [Gemmatimonadaceae bacterium]|nr:SRPBCC domain-containing protein [Gemmatimonadaceae bacterium]
MSTKRSTQEQRDGVAQSSGGGAGRTVAREIRIGAPAAAVWRALTEARELARWFPLQARITPGPGGRVWMSWDGAFTSDARIAAWEPERHLRIDGFPADLPHALITDYYLDGRGGTTVLRVVSSGFGAGESWDELYDGVTTGWNFELRGLRHYLERHAGQDRHVAYVRAPYAASHEAMFARLVGPGGWFGAEGFRGAPGARYAARAATGEALAGTVEEVVPGRLIVLTADGFNDALLRLECIDADGGRELWAWLATWDVPKSEVEAVDRRWKEWFTAFTRQA